MFNPVVDDIGIETDIVADLDELDLAFEDETTYVALPYSEQPRHHGDVDEGGCLASLHLSLSHLDLLSPSAHWSGRADNPALWASTRTSTPQVNPSTAVPSRTSV